MEYLRNWKTRKNGKRFKMLNYATSVKHGGRKCKMRRVCGVNGCLRKHNKLLHDEEFIKKST